MTITPNNGNYAHYPPELMPLFYSYAQNAALDMTQLLNPFEALIIYETIYSTLLLDF